MPVRHRHRHSSERRKSITITLESCSRSVGIRVHDALETVNTMRRNMHLEALAAIRALDQVKLHAAWGAAIVRGYAGVDYWLETVLHINALRIA